MQTSARYNMENKLCKGASRVKQPKRYVQRFFIQSTVLLLLMSITAFFGVYASGRAAYRSANELGAMTADYLTLQIDSFLRDHAQILGDAAHTVEAMLEQGMSTSQVEQWLTDFSDRYAAQMSYNERGLYGSIRGQAVYSSGWVPGPDYDIASRPWYQKAVAGGGACVRSEVYPDYQHGTAIVSLSMLLSDGVSVLALDIRAGDIHVNWQDSGALFPGTATVIDQNGNLVLHQQIRQNDHTRCELDQFTQQDYVQWIDEYFTDDRSYFVWHGQEDSYQNYYIVDEEGWTCIITIPRSVITKDATALFYFQLGLECLFLLVILYLSAQNYLHIRRNQKTFDCFEALGQTYYCVVLVDTSGSTCEVSKYEGRDRAVWESITDYHLFLTKASDYISGEEDRARFLERFSAENLEHLRTASDRCYMEYQIQTSSGLRWASAEGFWVRDLTEDSHVILGFRAIHAEKTKSLEQTQMLRTSLEHARLASQAKNDFLSRMSHDMRTPMNAVMGFADMARNNLDQPERARECLDKVSAASAQLLHLINEVLDTAKIEQGKMELHPAPVDLRRHLEETAAMFQIQAQAHHQAFSLELSLPASPLILTDGNRLNQILNNLLTNAIKYTPAGGRITLRAEELPGNAPDERFYRFTVSDNGIGMAPEFLERIFLPFEREDTSMTNQTSGVGLGMAITHSIVEMMGGRIDVQSQRGKGSTFTVLLPCRLAQQSPAPQPTAGGSAFSLDGLCFLLAEDNSLNMEIATELLKMEGASITPVQNGQEAVDVFSGSVPGTFDAIILDIQMPVLDGYGAARAIRALPRPDAQTIPILAMTANAFTDDIAAAREAGMNAHIAKPMDIRRIKSVLAAVLQPPQ